MKKFVFIAAAALALGACKNNSMETFNSKVYLSSQKTTTILLDGKTEDSHLIQSAIPQPEETEVSITYGVEESLLEEYKLTFLEEDIQMLPAENYQLETEAKIPAGAVLSTETSVNFTNLKKLDTDLTYVLPVTITSSSLEPLKSARTLYYIFRGAALINTVPQMKENYFNITWANAGALNNLKELTAEVLLYPNDFKTAEAGISTIMGIENKFLIRIGDSGIDNTQIQIAKSGGNVTDPAWKLERNKWQHLAVTVSSDGTFTVYIDGVQKGQPKKSSISGGAVSWGNSDFHIGYSYNDARWFDGTMSEIRIWNRALTHDEINAKDHFYKVDEPYDASLVAYWKLNEGSGAQFTELIHGNNASAKNPVSWKEVSLPEKE